MSVVPPDGGSIIGPLLDVLRFVGQSAAQQGIGQAAIAGLGKLAGLVRARLKGRPMGEQILDQYVDDPETWTEPLRKTLIESGADADPEIREALQQVVTLLRTQNIAIGKNVAQGPIGQIGHLGDQITINFEQPKGLPGDGGDHIVSGPTFDKELKPELERRYDVKLPREGEEFAFLQRGWQETYVTHRGQRKRVVVGAPGQINAVPVIRRRLSEKAKRILVAAHRVTGPRMADSIKWHKSDGTIGISGEEATGAEGRHVCEELTRDGLVRDESQALLRLTDEGRRRADELIAEGY